MKWPQLLIVFIGVVAVAIAVRSRTAKMDTTPASPPPSPALDVGRALPPSFDRPGVVSRRIGVMRVSLAVPPEIALASADEASDVAVSLLLVLENDTYQPLPATRVGWLGAQLGTVRVTRIAEGEREADVFQTELPLPTRADWLSAERRTFTVDWPLHGATPGTYKIAVQLALSDQPVVEILTRVL